LQPGESSLLNASRPCILACAASLAFLGSLAPAGASEESLGLEGTWQLVHRENFDQYLKESGAPWWKRRLAQLGSSLASAPTLEPSVP
jgi:hypothetical protein